ncbi:MAG: putative heme-binding domain protein, partial [Verrucomicrobiales bacterium]|nr:putative heme-binding domain protein [Verrucomicrobiales bacterium]
DSNSVKAENFSFKIWSLIRSANYGSNHYNEHSLEIASARLGADNRSVVLEIPALAPTQCYELKLNLLNADGGIVERSLHGTIHQLSDP